MDTVIKSYGECPCNGECRNCTACHFVQYPDLVESSTCMECRNKGSLWFCLTCGHIGCDSSNLSHALDHHTEIKHAWIIGLENFDVWDCGNDSHLSNLKALEPQLNVNANAEVDCECPVCRYHQIPKLSDVATCMSCSGTTNLWLCLSCRYIGCGRLQNGHALHHYQRTEHSRVMQLKTFRIWDYKEDKYVHRLYKSECPKESPAVVGVTKTDQDEDFERRMKRLEDEWNNFSTLKETNLQMISIEQRLLTLSEEKKMFEEKLREHDVKLNELLSQFRSNQQRDMLPTTTDRNHNVRKPTDNVSMDIPKDQSAANVSTSSTNENKPMLTITFSENFEPTQWIHLCMLLLLFFYNFCYFFIQAFSRNS